MNALITGASSGIGKEIAYILAGRGYNLILVARSADKLRAVAHDIERRYKVKVFVLSVDLSESGAALYIFEEAMKRHLHIDVLVNNAGFGKFGNFFKFEIQTYEKMIELNVSTLTKLTHLFGKEMIRAGKGWILNVASTAAFQPLPNFAVYAATKSYVKSLSIALHYQLKNKGVVVTALCPGPTKTNFGAVAETHGTHMFNPGGLMDARKVAEAGIIAMFNGKPCVVPGIKNKILAFFAKVLPLSVVMNVVSKTVK
jgi:short-subunit dehydrogenase